ncbi:MAG: PAS domain S-box protein [Ignavibacteria bacterium]|nr:PAS domain S-box protein [Ignavibacteria bacterium]
MKNRYWFASIIIMLVFCSYLFKHFYEEERDKRIEQIINHQKIHARQAQKSFNEMFSKWNYVLFFLSKEESIFKMNEEGQNEVKKIISLFEEVRNISRVDKNGKIVYTYPFFDNAIGHDISNQNHVKKVLQTHKPVVSDVFTSVQGTFGIALHYPVFNKQNEFDGSIAFILDFGLMSKNVLDDIKIGESGHPFLISRDGTILYSSIKEHSGIPVWKVAAGFPEFDELIKKMISGKEGIAKYTSPKALKENFTTEKFVYFLPIKIHDNFWSLAVTYSKDEIISSMLSFRNKLIGIFSLILLFGISLSYFGIKGWLILNETNARKEAEENLRESERKYRLISSVASDYVFFSKVKDDNKLELEWAGGAFENITGYSVDEYKTKGGWAALLHPEDVEKDNEDFNRLKSKENIVTEVRTFKKTGEIVWVKVYAHPVWDEIQNKLTGIYGAVQDITSTKQAEETIKILSNVVEQSLVSIIITDLNGNIEYANRHICHSTGYTIQELLGQNPRIFKSGKISIDYYQEMWNIILSGNEWRGEFYNKKKNGELFWESAVISPLKNEKGEITHLIGIKEDITEKKKLLEELLIAKENAEKSDKIKSEFLAQMSHEIRTPINTILSFSSLLKEYVYNNVNSEIKDSFGIIDSAGKRIIRTIDLILNMSELVTNSFEYHPKQLSLCKLLLSSLIPEFQFKAKGKNLTLEYTGNLNNDTIFADEYTVIEIFQNLFDNAIKYTEKGKVEIRCYGDEKSVSIEISDTGIGISDEYQKKMFIPFSQEQQGYTRQFEGNGLGLALVKKYCEINGAEIKVESKKGIGSKFTVRFMRQ